jgi:proton glutamate symport protein
MKLSKAQRLAAALALGFLVVAAVLLTASREMATPSLLHAIVAVLWLGTLSFIAYAALRESLTTWILASMVLGTMSGYQWPHIASHLQVLSQIFLRLIRVIIAPLIFSTLVTGIARHSDLKKIGRIGLKSIIYFEAVTTIALVIGLAAVNIAHPGAGISLPSAPGSGTATQTLARPSASEFILHAFPENIAKSVAEGQVLQVVIFSILFGVALALVPETKRHPMLRFCESLAEVMFRFTNLVMLFAPIGVGAAIAYSVSQGGLTVLGSLARLVATLYIALIVFIVFVFIPIAKLAGLSIRRFVRAIAEPVSIAFGTSSSEAALPSAMEQMEAFGVPREIVSFVLPTGYSFNLDGSTLYLSLASVFVAQVAGIPLNLHQQLAIMLTLILTSKGVAGVSKAALVILLATVESFGLPSQAVLLLFGVDQLMDMARTATNVTGNCLASAVIARWEGELASERATAASPSRSF